MDRFAFVRTLPTNVRAPRIWIAACLSLAAISTGQHAFADPSVQSSAVVFEDSHSDPYDRTNRYGFNHAASVTVLGGDRVMAAWFSGPFEGSVDQLILGATSEDGGRTWDKAEVVNDAPHVSDFDPAFIQVGERTLLFFSTGRWERLPSMGPSHGGRPQFGVDSFQILMRTSGDQGHTWSDAREVDAGPGWDCRSNGIKLRNGTLLLPTHYLQAPHIASVLLSTDEGATWKRGPDIVTADKIGAAEPSVAELPSGNLVMVLRTTDGNLWLTRSDDHGATWQSPEKQDLPAATSSANLLCTTSGTLLLTHNPTPPPLRTELTMRASHDEGKSWSAPLTIATAEPGAANEDVWSRQVCYPSVCELGDGTLLVVWARILLSPDKQTGAICSARVHWN